MPSCTLPYNPVIASMSINGTCMQIKFKSGKTREYYDVPTETSYGLMYSKLPLEYFNQHIKKQFKVYERKN